MSAPSMTKAFWDMRSMWFSAIPSATRDCLISNWRHDWTGIIFPTALPGRTTDRLRRKFRAEVQGTRAHMKCRNSNIRADRIIGHYSQEDGNRTEEHTSDIK